MTFSVIQHRKIWYAFSSAVVLASLIALVLFGLKQGIEFTGGTLMAVRFSGERPSAVKMQEVLAKAIPDIGEAVVQPAGDKDAQLRFKPLSEEEHQKVITSFRESFGEVDELRFDAIGPTIGNELRAKSIRGLLIVLIAIALYIAYVFRKVSAPVESWKYGAITVAVAFHDVIVPVGVFALLGRFYGTEIGTPFIAAILTILGYSITDTIVVMDRTRENLQKMSASFAEIVDTSVRQTFLRSFNTSFTTLLALIAIFLFGGESLREFTLTLIIGIAIGTYSSIFIASPLLVTLEKMKKR